MIEIIPAILVHSEEEFRQKMEVLAGVPQTIQIDVMDGVFVNNTTWADPAAIAAMQLPYKIEVHLMVVNPVAAAERWFGIAQRILVHAESVGWQEAVKKIRVAGCETGIVLNPETPISILGEMLSLLDTVQIMGVTPGWSGQAFQPIAIEKTAALHVLRPEMPIEIDGGVGKETIPLLASAGATRFVAASALFSQPDFLIAYKELGVLSSASIL